jgi:hypothetical protein
MNVIHDYSDTIVYYDDVMSKVFIIRLKWNNLNSF